MNQTFETEENEGQPHPEGSQKLSSHNQDFFEKYDLQSTKVNFY